MHCVRITNLKDSIGIRLKNAVHLGKNSLPRSLTESSINPISPGQIFWCFCPGRGAIMTPIYLASDTTLHVTFDMVWDKNCFEFIYLSRKILC